MYLPSHLSPRPDIDLSDEKVAAFERLFAEITERSKQGEIVDIEYDLPAPKWQFLNWLCDTKDVLVHGSGSPDIAEFEPRQSDDVFEFGNRRAVYAASDGIWAMYFAIVDRDGPVRSLMNACIRVINEDGSRSDPYYFFSINGDALPLEPWRQGTIYILPRDTFEQQPPSELRGTPYETQQWASPVAMKPIGKIAVGPEDFPFLSQMYPHDPEIMRERATRDPEGFPWFDE
jgi:hypothetical protein